MGFAKRLAGIALAALALGLSGCGGGGGGGTVSVTYTTNWSTKSRATGSFQKVSVKRTDGTVVATQTLTQGSTSSSTTSFAGLAAGTYVLDAELYSDSTASTLVGEFETGITSTSQVTSDVGATPADLSVYPTSVSSTGTQQVFVAGLTSTSHYTFLSPADLTYTSNSPTLFTANSTGLLTGVAGGTGTLTVGHTPSSVTKTVSITVNGPARTKWTVLVYLNAANDLYTYGLLNMNQMEKLAASTDCRFVVQWKQYRRLYPEASFDGTRRYLVTPDNSNSQVNSQVIQDLGTGVDMGQAQTLRDFVTWGVKNYPADRTLLVVWDHGDGWRPARSFQTPAATRAISWDDEFSTAIDVWDMHTALQGIKLEAIAFDACDMQMAEVAGELENNCNYMTGSQDLTPGPGYPYNLVFATMWMSPNNSTKDILQTFSSTMVSYYPTTTITQSTWDMSKFGAFKTALDQLASALMTNGSAVKSILTAARVNTLRLDPSSSAQFYFDAYDLADKIKNSAGCPTAVQTACTNLQTAVSNLVVWHGASSDRANSHGVSVDFSPTASLNSTAYKKLQLAIDTQWDEFLLSQSSF